MFANEERLKGFSWQSPKAPCGRFIPTSRGNDHPSSTKLRQGQRPQIPLPPIGGAAEIRIEAEALDSAQCKIALGSYSEELWRSRGMTLYRRVELIPTVAPICLSVLNAGWNPWFMAVWGSDPQNVFAAGNRGQIVRCTAGSSDCRALDSGTKAFLRDIWGSDADNVYVVGDGGVLLRCAAGSSSCTLLPKLRCSDPIGWGGADSDNIYVAGPSARSESPAQRTLVDRFFWAGTPIVPAPVQQESRSHATTCPAPDRFTGPEPARDISAEGRQAPAETLAHSGTPAVRADSSASANRQDLRR